MRSSMTWDTLTIRHGIWAKDKDSVYIPGYVDKTKPLKSIPETKRQGSCLLLNLSSCDSCASDSVDKGHVFRVVWVMLWEDMGV